MQREEQLNNKMEKVGINDVEEDNKHQLKKMKTQNRKRELKEDHNSYSNQETTSEISSKKTKKGKNKN